MGPSDVLEARFTLEERRGAGGMGEVYAARDERSGKPVAVKVLRSADLADRTRFEREAEALAELQHPHIVRYIAHGVTQDLAPYLVMEWLDGEDLSHRLKRGMLGVGESVALAARVAEALSMAHQRGIVHRDLKPSNLFLPAGDVREVKVLDFGIAQLGGVTRVTETGILMGTPGYMAPEQARSGALLDARADVFSLGCVLFECLTGAPAFRGEHAMALLAKILLEEVPPPSRLRSDVPATLDALVAAMMAKNPHARPRDGAAVAEALTAIEPTVSASADDAQRSAAATALTGDERRLISVVLLGAPNEGADPPILSPVSTSSGPSSGPASVPSSASGSASGSASLAELAATAEASGARLEQLSDGSLLVTLATGVATDQAIQAARCALSLRARAATRPMALSMGRGELAGKLPLSDAIDRAALRLASAPLPLDGARPIAIDDVTAGLLDARFEVREGASGLELLGERLPIGEGRTLLGRATACVGRDVEIGTLTSLFDQCVEESVSKVALVTAPAGMGKSRLAHEFVRRLRRRGGAFDLWVGRGDSLRAGSAFSLLGQALRSAAGVREDEPLDAQRDKLRTRVALHVPAAQVDRVTEFLGEISGVELGSEDRPRLRAARQEPQLMMLQMRAAWEDFLRAECSAGPVILLLEDLHWVDRPTVRFIDAALGNLKDLPWMVLGLARPEVHELFPRLWDTRNVQELRLGALTPRASERLVREALGDRVSPEKAARLLALAEGHAFYLEEMIRAVADGRDEELPETVVAMVEARIARLTPPARRLLRAASVFGEAIWPGGVGALLGAPDEQKVTAEVASLVEQELLVRQRGSRFPGEPEFAFRHALLRQGAYAMLTPEDRSLGHRLAAAWLEEHGERDAMVLAEHLERGGESARAGGHYLRAAEQAYRAGDTDAAVERAHRGLATPVSDADRSALLALLCEIHAWRADYAAASSYAEEVILLSAPGTRSWARALLVRLGDTAPDDLGAFMAPIDVLERTRPEPDAISSLVFFLMAAAFLLDSVLRFDLADRAILLAEQLARPTLDQDPMARAFLHTAHAFHCTWARHAPAAGLEHARRAREGFNEASYRRGALLAQVFLGMNHWMLGAHEEATRELEGTMAADEELGPVFSLRSFCLIGALADGGDLAEAEARARELVAIGQARRSALAEGRGRSALAEVQRRRGALAKAEENAESARRLLSRYPLERLATLATLAATWLAQGRPSEALALAAEALALREVNSVNGFRGALARLVQAEATRRLGG
jgi:eukaryotic-like serine/threonine-protein kinase